LAAKKIVYSSALATVVAVLIYLSSIPGVRITTSGDITCSVCTSYFNITSSNYSLKFYKFDQRLTFSPEIKNYTLYRYTYGKWRETKFPINMTKGTLYQFKIVGYKFNPSDTIKWGVKSGDAEIDPYWLGEKEIKPTNIHTFIEPKYINSFSVSYDNGLKAVANDSKGQYLIKLKAFIENNLGIRQNYTLQTTNIPFNKLTDNSYKYNITIPTLPLQLKYVGLYFEQNGLEMKLNNYDHENSNIHMISFCSEDSCIDFDFSDVPINYSLTSKEFKLDIKGLSGLHIDPIVSFSVSQIEEINGVALSNTLFALTWCDEVADDLHLQIWDTNGTNTSDVIDIDSTLIDCATVGGFAGISAFNSTHFVVGWTDNTESDTTFAIYDSGGNLKAGPTDADATGTIGAVSVKSFNSTHFVIAWDADSELDYEYRIYKSDGTAVYNEVDIDGFINSAGTDAVSGIEIATFNDTDWVVCGIHEVLNITCKTYSWTTFLSSFNISMTTANYYSRPTNVDAFNSTHFIVSFWQDSEDDTSFQIFSKDGQEITSLIDVDTSAGNVYDTFAEPLNSTMFVVSWYDRTTDDDLKYAFYDSSGNIIGSIATIETWPTADNTPFYFESLISYETTVKTGFCNQNWVIAYANTTTQAIWRSYQPNGTVWDGICPAETTAPTYSLNSTNSTLAGTPIKHSLNWTDNVGLSGYIFNFCNGTWDGTNCLGTTTVLLLPNSTDNKAYKMTADITCPGTPESATTAFLDADYKSVNVSDSSYFSLTASCVSTDYAGDCIFSKYSFNVTKVNTTGPISSITYCIKGYYSNTGLGDASMFGWWRNTTNWYQNSTQSFGTTADYTYCVNRNSNIDSYIMSDGTFQVATQVYAQGADLGTATTVMYIDIVNVTVSYTTDWVNDTWVSMTGATNWSNVTKNVNSTVGANIAWCVYANDTSNNWNASSVFTYDTTSGETTTTTTTTSTTTTSTTSTTTTIPANCWTYDNVNHVLIIPSGCVYHNDTVGII